MSRRLLLAAPALLLAHRAVAQGSAPAAQPAPTSPGFHRFRLGEWTVTTLHDGFVRRPNALQGLVTNAPAEQVQATLDEAALPAQGLVNPYVITTLRTPHGVVFFDAGTGAGQMAAGTGQLPRSMEAAGIRPEEVTLVVVSHFHGDHITGLTTAENRPFFPNAEIAVPATEWAWWSDEANRNRSPEFQRGNFANTARRFAPLRDRMRTFDDGAEVAPGIHAIATHGHTPGHTAFHVTSGNEQMFVTADTAGRPELFLRHPNWHSVFDFDGAMAAESRVRLFSRIADERARLCAYHFNFPGTGYIARQGDGFRFVPADWSGAI
ncbi:MBL fold metallo-hydrolase [Sabulicella glaciei]|uniref:MBL fold metallo-hydrolase n=1 Tax=Sabulicella glaciei TaxID=2984948 RepID=A0ABT3P1L4_9PROT|nr:MBL fold metallo-hydrolase [Roseococcus sp. MDT2-1-1]